VVIPFALSPDTNPNLPSSTPSDTVNIYFRCICVSFASIRLNNPSIELQLTTNLQPPDNYLKILSTIGVAIQIIPFTFEPYYLSLKKYRTSFFIFDAIKNQDSNTLYIDPDVICTGSIKFKEFEDEFLGGLVLDFPSKNEINGISPQDAELIFSQLNQKSLNFYQHIGGELIYIPISKKRHLIDKLETLWNLNNDLARRGHKFLPTEEHFFSCLFSTEPFHNLDYLGLRIWTTYFNRFSEGGIFQPTSLPLWHLPAEKARCFVLLFNEFEKLNWETETDSESFRKLVLQNIKYKFPPGTRLFFRVLRNLLSLSKIRFD